MRFLRLRLDGLDAADRDIHIEQLREHWRLDVWTVPGQAVVLAALLPVIWRSTASPWAWGPLVALLLGSWTWGALSQRRLRTVGIQADTYAHWRAITLLRELVQSSAWGGIGALLWGALPSDWHLLILTGLIVFAFTAMFFSIHDSGVATAANLPIQLILMGRLLADDAPGTGTIALILAAAMFTCLGVGRLIERRLLEAERLRLRNAQLVGELEGEINKVRQARDEAQEANRQKSAFLAAASHDLRQPLHSLTLLSGMLTQDHDRTGAEVPAHLQQTAQRMQSAVDGLSFVFDQLFDIARLDAGKQAHLPRLLDLGEALRELHQEYAVAMEAKGLTWTLDAPPTPTWTSADPLFVQRIVRNLLDNALRYTLQGGVRLRWRRRADQWCVQVWDSGPGIARELRPRVFDDFVQGHNPQRQRREGLGLGLAMVRRLVQAGGYTLRLRSRPQQGSVFSLSLPVCLPPRRGAGDAQAHSAPTLAAQPPEGRLIVLVDDDDDVLHAMRDSLEALGWAIACGHDAREATEAVAAAGRMPLAVISDWRLAPPSGTGAGTDANADAMAQDGLACIAALRHEFGHALPAWLLTGDLDAQLGERCAAAGVRLLRKPQSANSLSAALNVSL